MWHALRRRWLARRLKDPAFAFLFEPWDGGELVSIDCETTGLDARRCELLSVGAVRVAGERIRTSERLELMVRPEGGITAELIKVHHIRPTDVARALPPEEAMRQVLRFIGPRPLLGYFVAFDAAVLERYARPLLGCGLPNRRVEVSRLYYDWRSRQLPQGANIDLGFETIRRTLDLPPHAAHDASGDALMAAMMYLRLKGNWTPPGGSGNRPS
ncbi:3'-5' exonuclease [Geminicoccaceae bacterium 1502E]|nr:3'-5' exonuclease [Geminicoccaceae bacterium 1502E]